MTHGNYNFNYSNRILIGLIVISFIQTSLLRNKIMNGTHSKNIKLLLLISVLIYLPFIESLSFGHFMGLKWRSPSLMEELRDYLVLIKLISVCIGLSLLSKYSRNIGQLFRSEWPSASIKVFNYLLGALQVVMLLLALLFISLDGDESYKHIEKQNGDYNLYVYTFDPGAMGRAYHYFYIKCPKPLGRYKLNLIKRTDWIGQFDFEVDNNNRLVIKQLSDNTTLHEIDLSPIEKCY